MKTIAVSISCLAILVGSSLASADSPSTCTQTQLKKALGNEIPHTELLSGPSIDESYQPTLVQTFQKGDETVSQWQVFVMERGNSGCTEKASVFLNESCERAEISVLVPNSEDCD